jgi:predicted enzyme involved in methoxymalonyl-ACP biosynthesis
MIIDTFVMSCRVLSRGMEEFVCNDLLEICQKKNIKKLIGEYRPTKKNKLVATLYAKLGFKEMGMSMDGNSFWEKNVYNDQTLFEPHITRTKW